MPRLSLIPDEALAELRERFGQALDRLSQPQLSILAAALLEDGVNNARMQELLSDHPTDITRQLTTLRDEGFLISDDKRRWSRYRLAGPTADLFQNEGAGASSTSVLQESPSVLDGQTEELRQIAAEVREKGKIPQGR